MDEYKAPYLILWRGCSAAIEAMDHQDFDLARQLLLSAQQQAELCYISECPSAEPDL